VQERLGKKVENGPLKMDRLCWSRSR